MISVPEQRREHLLLYVAITAAASIHVSIAASQILLGLGILLLLLFRRKLEFPRIWVPLLGFVLWTVLADLISQDPWGGRAQIKKLFVFLLIPLIYSVFVRHFSKVFYLIAAWTAAASASGLWSLVQFWSKYQAEKHAPEGFYIAYLRRRITGFESHWMTFGALQLMVLLLVLAHYFFSSRRMRAWAYSAVFLLFTTILLGWTRSIWLATLVSILYLIGTWRPRMLALVPAALVVVFFASPQSTRQRFASLFNPKSDVDSNMHRLVTFRTGLKMIETHPWFGIGPEEIGRNFNAYVPSDIPRPLPVGYYGHLHNIYLQYAAERGIPGSLLMLAIIGVAIFDCTRAIRHLRPPESQRRFVLHGTLAVILSVLVGGIFEYNLGDSEVLMMFLSVLGLAYAAIDSCPRHHSAVEQS